MEAGDRLNASRALTRFSCLSEPLMGQPLTSSGLFGLSGLSCLCGSTHERGGIASVATEHLRRKILESIFHASFNYYSSLQ